MEYYNNILVVEAVADLIEPGIMTEAEYGHARDRGKLRVANRACKNNTVKVYYNSLEPKIQRKFEDYLGGNPCLMAKKKQIADKIETDYKAFEYFSNYRYPDGSAIPCERQNNILLWANNACILNALMKEFEAHAQARAADGKKPQYSEFYAQAVVRVKKANEERLINGLIAPPEYENNLPTTPRRLRDKLEVYMNAYNEDPEAAYFTLIKQNKNNDNARKVSASMARLIVGIWRTYDKPFETVVHERYLEFVDGSRIIYDKKTGEKFIPEDFRYNGKPMDISIPTVRNYLKDVMNDTAVFADRNGNFDYMNKRHPKQKRKIGQYSLSKISMDDVAMSRKSCRGWVFKYISVDVLSDYWFRPAYIIGKPTKDTIYEAFRNMFLELLEIGLPMPGELEVENALMQHIGWLQDAFKFVRFAKSSTDKRAEHKIRGLKYGVAKKNGHTRGRWHAKHEAYRCVRNKVEGDFIEPEYQPQTIIADDLADIEEHNNGLHPRQKLFPGMTRKEVLIENFNPILKGIDPSFLWQFLGNETQTSIRNNDYCQIQEMDFWLKDYHCLNLLKPNNLDVTAYWLPEADGSINTAYLYQDGRYIGEVYNSTNYHYNEFQIERTDEDEANILHQNKRNAKYNKMIKDRREEIPDVYYDTPENEKMREETEVPEIVESAQPKNYDNYDDLNETTNWAAKAIKSL